MSPVVTHAKSVPAGVAIRAVGITVEGGDADGLAAHGLPIDVLAAQGFTGKADQVEIVTDADGAAVVAVGLGPLAELDDHRVRRASAQAVRASDRVGSLAICLLDALDDVSPARLVAAARAAAEGIVLGSYRFTEFRSEPPTRSLESVTIVAGGAKRVAAAVAEGVRIGEAQNLARSLVNTPGGTLTPALLAEAAVEIAEREDLMITVLGPDDIAERRLGGLLGVNRGSTQEPRFVEICYEPAEPKGTLALVGKGITFDSGGLSIKSGEGMMTMKMDMGGAAAVLGCFSAIRVVAPTCRVVGYLPMTDNMSNGDATRPGDVLVMRNGATVEVLNTDAEGRLVLADALCLASEAAPDAIVDLATLTGAVEVALGGRIAGVMANDDVWRDRVEAAAADAGERTWPLPLPADYRPFLDSDVADLRNISKSKGGGTMTAGLFLKEFVGEGIDWAHIDIAGTAWSETEDAEIAKGGTGYGVRLLLELARSFTPTRR